MITTTVKKPNSNQY